MPGWHWGHPVTQGRWETQVRGSGRLELEFGGWLSLWLLEKQIGGLKPSAGGSSKVETLISMEAAGWEWKKNQVLLPDGPRTPSD